MALDLAASGVDQRQASSLKSISDYFQPLMELMASLNSSQRVLLVGQSMGGLAISQAMERFPRKISVAVFVTATMPGPSLSVSISIMRDPFFSYWFRFSGSSMLRISI
ncbi:salicylic acid-binding protein 2-like [Punica granatum]|nr:salicylic acid-binding protein 2-like [Punica granatum]